MVGHTLHDTILRFMDVPIQTSTCCCSLFVLPKGIRPKEFIFKPTEDADVSGSAFRREDGKIAENMA